MTRTKRLSAEDRRYREFDRQMLRASVVSLFAAAIQRRRKSGKFTLQALADGLGKNKSEVSRWFSREPNWTLNTIADLAGALGLDIELRARERSTGVVFSPSGMDQPTRFVDVSEHGPDVTSGDGAPPPFFKKTDYTETSSSAA